MAARQLRATQRGFAMIAIVTLIAMIAAYLVADALQRTTAEVGIERDQRTLAALQEAKNALIGWSALQAATNNSNDQPGSLPCPATDAAGTSGSCSASSGRLGRLPWKTLGISDLRDSTGEILWYGVSANFRKASGTTVINSDTAGTLTVTGTTPQSNVVAVILAPGKPFSNQNRSVSAAGNFLEDTNAGGADSFVTGDSSDTFNDRLITITQADLMSVVEPAVAARIERDIKPMIQAHVTDWGVLPFPTQFNATGVGPGTASTRAQSAYLGSASVTEGLLPITSSVNSWSGFSVTKLSGNGTVAQSGTCTTSTGYQCTIAVTRQTVSGVRRIDNLKVQMTAQANYAGLSFNFKPTISDLSYAAVTFAGLGSPIFLNTSYSLSLNSSGVATITFTGTINYTCSGCNNNTRTIKMTFSDLTSRPISSSSDTTAGWFVSNQWYRQLYYAAAAGYLPSATCVPGSTCAVSCTAGSTCLTVSGLPSRYTTSNDKGAILILAGRALTGSRPSTALSNYLEGQNASTGDRTFVNRVGFASSVNDRVIVLYP